MWHWDVCKMTMSTDPSDLHKREIFREIIDAYPGALQELIDDNYHFKPIPTNFTALLYVVWQFFAGTYKDMWFFVWQRSRKCESVLTMVQLSRLTHTLSDPVIELLNKFKSMPVIVRRLIVALAVSIPTAVSIDTPREASPFAKATTLSLWTIMAVGDRITGGTNLTSAICGILFCTLCLIIRGRTLLGYYPSIRLIVDYLYILVALACVPFWIFLLCKVLQLALISDADSTPELERTDRFGAPLNKMDNGTIVELWKKSW